VRNLLAIILFLSPLTVLSQTHTYYFDAVNGNDANSAAQAQNSATAWKTLTKLNSFMTSLVAGDVVRFRRGQTFTGFIVANKAGTNVNPIRFATWDVGNRPIITSVANLDGTWTNLGSNIWETSAVTTTTNRTNVVTVNGLNTAMGRTPNANTYLTVNSHTNWSVTAPIQATATISTLTGTPNYVGAELVSRTSASYIFSVNTITNQATTVLTIRPWTNVCGFTVYNLANSQAFIQNSVSTLDVQNEWFWNTSTKRLRMFSTTTPTGVKMATIDSLVKITAGFLTFDSLDFQYANTDCFQLSNASDVIISNCNIAYVGQTGVRILNGSCPRLNVLNCTISDCGWAGVNDVCSGGTGRQIIGNTFRRMNVIPGAWGSYDGQNEAIGFYDPSTADSIRFNTIDSCGYNGIFDVGQSFTIRNNFVTNTCLWNTDGGAIYTGNHGVARNIIGNIVLRSPTQNGHGIYMDNNSTNCNVIGNTTYGFNLGIYSHSGHEILIRGNLCYANRGASFNMGEDPSPFEPIRNTTIRQNTFVMASAGSNLGNVAFQTPENSQTNFGTSDSNVIATPVNDVNAWYSSFNNGSQQFIHYTLAGWKGLAGNTNDKASTQSPKIVPDTTSANVRFIYNTTQSPQVTAIPGTWEDMRGNMFVGSITLQPFTSTVLLFVSSGGGSPLSASAIIAQNPVTCFGNTTSITINATGGTAPYQYKIGSGSFGSSNVFSALAAGTYSFQVRDAAGTIFSLNATITQPSQITISQSSGTILVNGGTTTTTVTASGGTGTLQYKLDAGSFQSSNVFTGVAAGTHTITVRDANLCTNTLTYTLSQPSTLVISATATTNPLTCFGNTTTITVTASGGTPPYNYSINGGAPQSQNTFTNRGAGTYTLTVGDNAGASKTTTLTITQPTQISITESHTAILVNGGTSTVTITASGGTGTKNYSINGTTFQSSNVFNNVVAGTYTVTVRDANLCTNTLTFTITQPTSLNVSAIATTNPLTCFGNTTSITVTASGGTSPYQYSINGGTFQSSNIFTNRGAGTYTITVRDAALVTQTTTVTITQPTQISISESHTAIAVNGGTSTLTITASGGTGSKTYSINGTTFQSSNVFSNVVAGTYTVTVKDANNCTNTLTVTITQPTALLTSSSVTTAIACNGGSGVITVTASGGTPPYRYRQGTTGIFGSSNIFTVTAGTYQFFVTDAGGAVASSTTTISQPTIISVSVSVSGNAPATVTVTASGGVGTINYQLDGGSFQSSNVFTGVSSGNHTIVVRDANSCTQSRVFNVGVQLQIFIGFTAITCNGGQSTVTVGGTGGTPPYTGQGQFARTAGTWTFSIIDQTGAQADTTIVITQPSAISISNISFSAIVVNGGTTTVTVTASGGVGTLNYKLDAGSFQTSNSFAGVSAGNHTITVRDGNGCLQTQSFSISQPGTLEIGIVVGTAIACNGGTTTVTVTGSGGTTPYTYGKNGTFQSAQLFSSVTAGTYTFSVKDAFSNQKDTIITISQPTALTLSIVTGTIVVNGGTTTVTASGSGGTGSLQYSLDGGAYQGSGSFSGVAAGTHTVTLKDDNSCTTTNTFSITEPNALVVGISVGGTLACYGDVTTVTVSGTNGTAPYTYGKNGVFQSGTLFSSIAAGTYTFSVKDAFGTQADTIITISQPSQIAITVTTGTILVNGGTTTVTASASGGTGGLQYSLDGGAYQGSGSFSGVSAGPHTVTAKDANSCTNVNTFSISEPGELYITATPTLSSLDCYGDQTTVTVSGSGGTTPLTYGKNGVFQGSGTFGSISAGTYTFSVKDAFNVQHDTVLTITQPPLITLLQIVSSSISVYGGLADSVIISNAGGTPFNDTLYEYSLDGGGFTLSDTSFAYVIYNVAGGSHTIEIRDANGCSQTYTFDVPQPPAPLPYMIRSKRIKHVYQQL